MQVLISGILIGHQMLIRFGEQRSSCNGKFRPARKARLSTIAEDHPSPDSPTGHVAKDDDEYDGDVV